MSVIDKTQLIKEVKLFLDEINANCPTRESLEWYLGNNLSDYLKEIEHATTLNDIKVATKLLSRFCLESMDWDTVIFKRCTKITKIGLKLAKSN